MSGCKGNCKCKSPSKVVVEFDTPEEAAEFISWYDGGGEQLYYEHLDIIGKERKMPNNNYETKVIDYRGK